MINDQGWVYSVLSGKSAQRNVDNAGRIVAIWRPTSDIDFAAFAQRDVTHLKGMATEFVTSNAMAQNLQALAGAPGTLEARLDRRTAESLGGLGNEPFESLRVDRAGLTGNIDLGFATLTSVTGYAKYRDLNDTDIDQQAGDYQKRHYEERSSNFSQEVRLVSPGGQPVDWLLGGLYIDNRLRSSLEGTANYPNGGPTGRFVTDFYQRTRTGSFFGQATVRLSDSFRVTGGARYTIEKKDADLARTVIVPGVLSLVSNPPYAPFSRSRKDSPFDYSGGLQYDIAPNILAYASYGKGTKSGGFASNVQHLDQSEYENETARTIEVGLKTQDRGRRWLFNLSLYDTKVDDFQVVTFNNGRFDIFNTDLSSKGFEVEAYWYPVKAIRLFVNNTYADAKDRNTGLPIPLAPKWSGTAGFAMRTPFAQDIDLLFDGSVDYRSTRTYQQNPAASTISPPFQTLNLGVALARPDDSLELRVIGRNLLDAIAPAFSYSVSVSGAQALIPERGADGGPAINRPVLIERGEEEGASPRPRCRLSLRPTSPLLVAAPYPVGAAS